MGFLNFLSPKKQREERAQNLIEEANRFTEEIKAKQTLSPITTSFLLKEGEEAYLETDTTLLETRAIRYHTGSGMGLRIMKGVYVGGGSGSAESKEEWRAIDKGKLLLTNKRLIFDGGKADRTIPLEKIFSINPSLDSITLSAESRNKSMLFTVGNSCIWAVMIHILTKSGGDPKKIDIPKIDFGIRA